MNSEQLAVVPVPVQRGPRGRPGPETWPLSNFFRGTPGFTSVRLHTNDLIICNHQGTRAALEFPAFAEKYQEVNGANHFSLKAPFLYQSGFDCEASFTQL